MNIVESKIVFRLLPAGNNKYLIAGFWEETLKMPSLYCLLLDQAIFW